MTKNQKKQLKALLKEVNAKITNTYTEEAERDNEEKPKIPTTLQFKITLVIDHR